MRRAALLIALLALSLGAGPLLGAGCSISTAGPIAFGTYDVFATGPLDTTGSISYSCTQPVQDPVLSISAGGSGTFAPRRLAGGAYALGYNLYLDASHTQLWGDGTGGTYTHTGGSPADSQTYTVTIFGRIPAGQNVAAGSYSDTLTVTMDF